MGEDRLAELARAGEDFLRVGRAVVREVHERIVRVRGAQEQPSLGPAAVPGQPDLVVGDAVHAVRMDRLRDVGDFVGELGRRVVDRQELRRPAADELRDEVGVPEVDRSRERSGVDRGSGEGHGGILDGDLAERGDDAEPESRGGEEAGEDAIRLLGVDGRGALLVGMEGVSRGGERVADPCKAGRERPRHGFADPPGTIDPGGPAVAYHGGPTLTPMNALLAPLLCSILLQTEDSGAKIHAASPVAAWMAEAEPADSIHWPSFRGFQARGVSEGRPTPAEFDLESGFNVRWRSEIPGLCHSCPIVWGDRVFVTTAVKEGEAELQVGLYGSTTPVPDEGSHHFLVLCLDKKTGELLWERTALEAIPKIKRHPKGSHAASTPATDGEHVVAFFGSEGLYCYDVDGELLWKKDLGRLEASWYMNFNKKQPNDEWGFASSPVIWDGLVIVQCDILNGSFAAAFDVSTGEEVWRVARDEVPTWCTPSVFPHEGRDVLVLNGWKHIGGYDLRTGAEVWKTMGGGDIPVPTPVTGEGLIFLTSAHGMFSPIRAVRVSAKGELPPDPVEDSDLVWKLDKRGNYMQTPLYHAGYLYCCNDAGILACYQASDGKELYRERIGGGTTGFTASGVACGDKLYFTSEEGDVYTVKAGPEFEIVGENALGETCMATPAISDGALFFRARSHLVAIAED